MKGEFLTEPVIARVETWLPALTRVEDKTKVFPRQLFSLITVESPAGSQTAKSRRTIKCRHLRQ